MFNSTGATLSSVINSLMQIIYSLEWLLGGVALVIFLWGCVKFISDSADQKGHKDGYTMIVWGLIALFVIFSIQGILWLMCIGLLGNGSFCGAAVTGGAPT